VLTQKASKRPPASFGTSTGFSRIKDKKIRAEPTPIESAETPAQQDIAAGVSKITTVDNIHSFKFITLLKLRRFRQGDQLL
jgi:hypothetical protein